jgi:hypothetical protein
MKPTFSALEALRAQVQFEVVEAGAAVAAATEDVLRTEDTVEHAIGRCKVVDDELRRALKVARVNPPLLGSLRALSRSERSELSTAKSALARARAAEEAARAALTALRNRERSFQRALQSALAEERRQFEARETVCADESWLQRSTRAVS